MLPAVERTLLYDQDRDVDAPGYDVTWTVPGHVVLSTLEADLIASMLDRARPHVPSRQAVDDAIALLTGKREA